MLRLITKERKETVFIDDKEKLEGEDLRRMKVLTHKLEDHSQMSAAQVLEAANIRKFRVLHNAKNQDKLIEANKEVVKWAYLPEPDKKEVQG